MKPNLIARCCAGLLAGSLLANLAGAQVPAPDLDGVEPLLAEQVLEARQLIEDSRDGGLEQLAEAWGELGMLYQALEYEAEALTAYRQAQDTNPFDGRWPYLIGMVLARQGQSEAAQLHFLAAIALMPSQATSAWTRIARVLLDAGQAEQALQAAGRALAINDRSAAALAVQGEARLALEQPSAAVESLLAALAIEPRANRLRFPLGMAYRALGDMEAMEQALNQAGQVGVTPDDPVGEYLQTHARGSRIHALRARRAYAAGDLEQALRLFQRATEFDQDNAELWVNLGATQAAMGLSTAAITSLERALLLNPQQQSARINLASIYASEGQIDEAWRVVGEPGVELNQFSDLVLRARIARRVDQLEAAARDYLAALDLDKDLQVWQEAIEVLLALGRYSEVEPLATHPGLNEDGLAQVASLTDALLSLPDGNMAATALAGRLSEHLFEVDGSLAHVELRVRALLASQPDCRLAIQWLGSLAQRHDWPGDKTLAARSLALDLARQPRCQSEP